MIGVFVFLFCFVGWDQIENIFWEFPTFNARLMAQLYYIYKSSWGILQKVWVSKRLESSSKTFLFICCSLRPNFQIDFLLKPNYFKKQRSTSSFLLTGPKWLRSLNRLVPCLKWMELGCQVLLGNFRPVYLLQVSKNDDEEQCFHKKGCLSRGWIEKKYTRPNF